MGRFSLAICFFALEVAAVRVDDDSVSKPTHHQKKKNTLHMGHATLHTATRHHNPDEARADLQAELSSMTSIGQQAQQKAREPVQVLEEKQVKTAPKDFKAFHTEAIRADATEKREMDEALADRDVAEKAIVAKAASNKAKAAGDIAIDAINAKTEALRQKHQAEKAVEDACARVEQLEAPLAKATAEWIATSEAVQADTAKEENAVASRAILDRSTRKRMPSMSDAAAVEKAAESAAKDAKDSQAEHEAYSKLVSEKRIGLAKAEDELTDLDTSKESVDREAKHNDVELVKTLADQKHAAKFTKVQHAIMLKAKKDAADMVERAAAETTLLAAAKEESHRAAARGFHKLYEKVEAEQQLKEAFTTAPTPASTPPEEVPANNTDEEVPATNANDEDYDEDYDAVVN